MIFISILGSQPIPDQNEMNIEEIDAVAGASGNIQDDSSTGIVH